MQNPKLTRISGTQPPSLVWWLLCLVVKLIVPGAQVGEHVGGGQPEVGDAGASAAGDGGRRLGLQFLILTCGISTTPLSTLVYMCRGTVSSLGGPCR